MHLLNYLSTELKSAMNVQFSRGFRLNKMAYSAGLLLVVSSALCFHAFQTCLHDLHFGI